jgi:alkylhydroperoxidase family enzyme
LHGSADPARREKVALLPSIVREVAEDTAFADALVENLVRTDLTRKETLDAVAQLQREYGWSGHQIANRTGRNPSDINTLLRISKHPIFYRLVSEERINPSVAGILMRLSERGQEAVIERLEDDRHWSVTADDARRFVDSERAGNPLLDDAPLTASPMWVNSPTSTRGDLYANSRRHTAAAPSVDMAPEHRSASPEDAAVSLPATTHQMGIRSQGERMGQDELAASSVGTGVDASPLAGEPGTDTSAGAGRIAGLMHTAGDPEELVHVSTHTRRRPGVDHAPGLQVRRGDGEVEDFARYILAWAHESAPLTSGQRTLLGDAMAQVWQTLGLPS